MDTDFAASRMISAFPESQGIMLDTDIPDLLLFRQPRAQLLTADRCEDDSSIMAAFLSKHGISDRVLWDKGSTVVRKYTWEGSSSTDGTAAEPASVAEKIWDAERVRRDGGYVQVAAEMKCAFWGVDERGLVVVPIEYSIGVSSGLSVFYPYAGTNLAQHFNLLRATKSPNLYEQINIAAVHLGLGLQDVHKKNLVLRDCKATNALFSANDGVYRWSDAGLSCTTGSRWGGSDDSRPAPDHVRRYGSGRVYDSPWALSKMNEGPLDVYACGVVLYEAAVGELPRPINYNCRYDYIGDVPSYSEQELWDMDVKAREKILTDAMFDRTVTMVEDRGWWPYLRDNIAPHDMLLASFLTRIFRPREERAPLEELLQHEYIASILAREEARIQSALPAWRARVQAAGELAKVVKLARAKEEVQKLLQQKFAARSGGATTGSSSITSNTSTSLTGSDCSPSESSSSIGSQVVPVQYNKPCGKSRSCYSTAERTSRYSGDTSGAVTTDQLAGLDNNSSSSTSGISTSRQTSKGWGSCSSSSSSRTSMHAGHSTTELPEAMPASGSASPKQHQPQAFGSLAASMQLQAVSPQAAATAPPQSPSALPEAACTQQQQQQQAEPQSAALSPCSAGVTQQHQQPQAAASLQGRQEQLHVVQQQRREVEREACLAAAWLAVQQQELLEAQAALQELQQQVEAVEPANAAAEQQTAAYQQQLAGSQDMVVAVLSPSRPAAAAADRVLPASTAQGGRTAGGLWQQVTASTRIICCGVGGPAINLRSHPIDIDMDDDG